MIQERERIETGRSLLSDRRVLEHMIQGNIIIREFNRENLGTASYDVNLGEYYFQEQKPEPGQTIYSPYSQTDVKRVWGDPQQAIVAEEYVVRSGNKLPEGIFQDDKIILIPPGETFLCHTQEFIGGRNIVTTMMKARSSWGRNFIEVCKCAGWGDVGYVNRWTMEVTNNSRYYTIPLAVNRRIGQIAFFEVDPILAANYTKDGKYQTDDDIESVMEHWTPFDMLPKMYRDREITRRQQND